MFNYTQLRRIPPTKPGETERCDESCMKTDELCIKNDEFCIINDDLCIKNDEFCTNK